MLNYEFPPLGGGSSSVSHEIGKRYVANGHDVDVITMGFEGLPDKEEVDGITVFRVKCLQRYVEITRLHELATYVYSAQRFLMKRLAEVQYDVCHAHFLLPTGIVARSIKHRFGLPYVISAHGSDVPGYNPDRFLLVHRFTRPLLERVGDDAHKIVVMSDFLGDLIRKNVHAYTPEKICRIPNGVDTRKFRSQEKRKIILSTGRLLPRKGFQHLIRAVSREDVGFDVHICGDGPMRDELTRMAIASKTKIVFHGWLNNESDAYLNLLGSASIYVLASAQENNSISLLEAMSVGCATITTTAPGCRETLGDAGILVRPANCDDIGRAIVSLISDDQYRLSLQRKAVDRARTHFDWSSVVASYENELALAAGM